MAIARLCQQEILIDSISLEERSQVIDNGARDAFITPLAPLTLRGE
jgi:hypothetical protein